MSPRKIALIGTTGASFYGFRADLIKKLIKNKYDENSSFLSGCYTLGEILEKQGYQNRILMGSDANFGCTSNFYKQHGNFKIVDYNSAIENQLKEYNEFCLTA